ncbi:hypothetical protein ACMATS_05950 [Streptoverticillium reticulum]|uniref:hypothetical protein n=1 Tax=Streptoverticillium reticulum TaxID=1433415 RepID=UPI0039BEE135
MRREHAVNNSNDQATPARPPTPEEQIGFLAGRGEEKYAKLEVGQKACGEITEILWQQDSHFGTREPKWIEPGIPQMMLTLRLRDGEGAEANRWIVDVRAGQKRDVINTAVADAGARFLKTGGYLSLTCVSKTGNKRIFAATYTPPKTGGRRPASAAAAQRSVEGAFDLPGDAPVADGNTGFPVPDTDEAEGSTR